MVFSCTLFCFLSDTNAVNLSLILYGRINGWKCTCDSCELQVYVRGVRHTRWPVRSYTRTLAGIVQAHRAVNLIISSFLTCQIYPYHHNIIRPQAFNNRSHRTERWLIRERLRDQSKHILPESVSDCVYEFSRIHVHSWNFSS